MIPFPFLWDSQKLRIELIDTVSGYRIREEKALARSTKSLNDRRISPFVHYTPRAESWSQCSLYPASNQRAASKLSVKPKNSKKFPPRRSTVATPPEFYRPTNRRYATQQKEKPHSRHARIEDLS
ncbi:hypothetical protein TNCV_2299811 [Trichonephila clavipes]|nr:hypothetical protein TNCV_2299811 [Trichonephila clavipes]